MERTTIRVSVNGKEIEIPSRTTVAGLIVQLGLHSSQVAVERNYDVVPRASHSAVLLDDGDRLELVTFVGGGSP
ncbi:MAG: sulfur carrier protein ThiS [Pseudomonadota bacterium]